MLSIIGKLVVDLNGLTMCRNVTVLVGTKSRPLLGWNKLGTLLLEQQTRPGKCFRWEIEY